MEVNRSRRRDGAVVRCRRLGRRPGGQDPRSRGPEPARPWRTPLVKLYTTMYCFLSILEHEEIEPCGIREEFLLYRTVRFASFLHPGRGLILALSGAPSPRDGRRLRGRVYGRSHHARGFASRHRLRSYTIDIHSCTTAALSSESASAADIHNHPLWTIGVHGDTHEGRLFRERLSR